MLEGRSWVNAVRFQVCWGKGGMQKTGRWEGPVGGRKSVGGGAGRTQAFNSSLKLQQIPC